MKHIHTPSHTFMAVKFDTTGSVDRKPFDVVKKLSIVVTPANNRFPAVSSVILTFLFFFFFFNSFLAIHYKIYCRTKNRTFVDVSFLAPRVNLRLNTGTKVTLVIVLTLELPAIETVMLYQFQLMEKLICEKKKK